MKMGDKIATRVAYGKALLQLGMENPHVMAIDADLACCTMSKDFAGSYPELLFQCRYCRSVIWQEWLQGWLPLEKQCSYIALRCLLPAGRMTRSETVSVIQD